jgi:hypothetical protein
MDSRQKEVDTEFTRCYTLDSEAFKKLIAEKMRRAEMYTSVYKQQERQVLELAE